MCTEGRTQIPRTALLAGGRTRNSLYIRAAEDDALRHGEAVDEGHQHALLQALDTLTRLLRGEGRCSGSRGSPSRSASNSNAVASVDAIRAKLQCWVAPCAAPSAAADATAACACRPGAVGRRIHRDDEMMYRLRNRILALQQQ